MRARGWLSALMAVVVVGLCAWGAFRIWKTPRQEKVEPDTSEGSTPLSVRVAVVESAPISEEIKVPGVIQPLPNGVAKVGSQLAGRLARVYVRPGDVVKQGQLLALVERPDLQDAAGQAQAAKLEARRDREALAAERAMHEAALGPSDRRAAAGIAAAKAKLDLLRAGQRPEAIEQAKAALDSAQADLDRLRAGALPLEVQQAESAVRDARATMNAVQRDLTRKQGLFEKGIVAAKDVEKSEADLVTAQSALESKQAALALLKAGARPEELRAQEGRVREAAAKLKELNAGSRAEEIRAAEADLSAAESEAAQAATNRRELEVYDRKLRSADAKIQGAQRQAEAAAGIASRREVRSPLTGTVTRLLANTGESVPEQTPIVEIMNRDTMRAVLQLAPAVASKVRVGSRVTLTLPAMPGLRLAGLVRSVPPITEVETGLATAEVWITDPSHRLTEGTVVEATLPAGAARRAIRVPSRALFAREGESYVYVIRDGEAHEQSVEPGAESGDFTEIKSGLQPGDRIAADGSLSLADGTKVQAAP